MAWTAPTTRSTGELITASIWNTDLIDNLAALKAPPSASSGAINEASDYTTTSGTFVNVDNTQGKFLHTITTSGGDVLAHFQGHVGVGGGEVYFDISVDAVRQAGNDGMARVDVQSLVSLTWLVTGLSAASHAVRLMWKYATGTGATLYAGAGTVGLDTHPQFWVREVS